MRSSRPISSVSWIADLTVVLDCLSGEKHAAQTRSVVKGLVGSRSLMFQLQGLSISLQHRRSAYSLRPFSMGCKKLTGSLVRIRGH